METTALRLFAAWARTALIREVSARISVVLASQELRQEQPNAVGALEKAVTGAGDQGRDTVAERVAYTWFNRIIALRFMDANGYTGIGVVSPERGREGGQPELLAEAKRGNIDSAVVTNKRTVESVTSLLNGTRRSDDPQGEAYALLLAEYCRHWNGSLPFMFEREGDYTELLIPANLLADGSMLTRAVSVLTEEVCQDVEVIGWLYQFYISERKEEIFAGFKKNKKAGAAEIPAATQLFTPHWIVRYLVENSLGRLWMLNRPMSRLVDQMDYYIAPVAEETDFLKINSPEELKVIDPACGSGHMLTYAFDLLYAIYAEEGYAPADIPGLILTHNLYGTEIDPRAGALAAFALTMKARARQRTLFTKKVEPNVCVLEPISFTPQELDFLLTSGGDRHAETSFWNQFEHADTFGALIVSPTDVLPRILTAHLEDVRAGAYDLLTLDVIQRANAVLDQAGYLTRRYNVVVANPPYMGTGNMGAELTSWVVANYPVERQDLYACFLNVAKRISLPRGVIAMIVGDTWLALPSFEGFREELLGTTRLESLVHLDDVSNHPDIFGANTAFIMTVGLRSDQRCRFIALEDNSADQKDEKLQLAASGHEHKWVHEIRPTEFANVPGSIFAYKLTDEEFEAFESGVRLGDIVELREGINTGENERFLRRWWEVAYSRTSITERSSSLPSQKWVPHKKGGAYRKWAGNDEFVVNWLNNGAEIRASPRARPQNTQYFFRRSVSWSRISSGEFSLRYYDNGYAFDSTGPSGFGADHDLELSLAFLNSNLAKRFLAALSPTLDYRLRNMGNLPGPRDREGLNLSHVEELVSTAQRDWDEHETAPGYTRSPLILAGKRSIREAWDSLSKDWSARVARTVELESVNNAVMADAYGLHHVDTAANQQRVSLWCNPDFALAQIGAGRREEAFLQASVAEFVSYAVGCMFGRFSLDEPGLLLADQGGTLQDYLVKVPVPTYMPDADNVIPIVDGDWFEDDIVARFRQFLRVAFGEQQLEENLRFVTEALGVKDMRDYFLKSFYKDHVQRYKKRPIYWLFSSSKGSFSALIYIHRYTPSTVSTVLNEYLREFKAKLEASRQHHERLTAGSGTPREKAAAQKEVDRLRKVLLELDEYEHDVLYPLATQQVQIDLDDGVKVNYPKFGTALKKIPGLEANDE
ncbi:BREX-1 system adenine-specific DNA-methyltransferase PglX [Arthrobacter sp. SO3]|uniref:BREX-1 system adenine-specific DNA-methyltransferase PglX n=1 Tax=Arthrobacter sp. SO3 TaxID=1897057 RepID=UPI001CFFB58F|nr:BREX-1 system adenine-specific DNA-methyltransferase PglX [Arthrobacter sp. SO3]MCB5294486.1 hypothetical protein [Arthrobacter sp. SO3]